MDTSSRRAATTTTTRRPARPRRHATPSRPAGGVHSRGERARTSSSTWPAPRRCRPLVRVDRARRAVRAARVARLSEGPTGRAAPPLRHRRPDRDRQDRPRHRARGGAPSGGHAGRDHLRGFAPGLPRARHRDGEGHRRRARAGRRTTASTSSSPTSRSRSPTSCARAAALRRSRRRGGVASWSAGPGSTCARSRAGLDTDALPSDAAVRAAIEAALAATACAPVARLTASRPSRRRRIDLANPRRVARALEIASSAATSRAPRPAAITGPVAWLGLDLADAATHARWIAARARRAVRRRPGRGGARPARALRPGAAGVQRHRLPRSWSLLDGERSLEDAIADDARRNVRFAKRQRTWFRAEPDIAWLDAGSTGARALTSAALAQVVDLVGTV